MPRKVIDAVGSSVLWAETGAGAGPPTPGTGVGSLTSGGNRGDTTQQLPGMRKQQTWLLKNGPN